MVQESVLYIVSNLDDTSNFTVNFSFDRVNGKDLIKANIKSENAELFYSEIGTEISFNEIILWFDPDNYKLYKFAGVRAKSKKGTEMGIGLSSVYTAIFKNVIFNPEIPPQTFDFNLSKYEKVVLI